MVILPTSASARPHDHSDDDALQLARTGGPELQAVGTGRTCAFTIVLMIVALFACLVTSKPGTARGPIGHRCCPCIWGAALGLGILVLLALAYEFSAAAAGRMTRTAC